MVAGAALSCLGAYTTSCTRVCREAARTYTLPNVHPVQAYVHRMCMYTLGAAPECGQLQAALGDVAAVGRRCGWCPRPVPRSQ